MDVDKANDNIIVTIAICVYNGEDVLGRCLESIEKQTISHDCFDVLVFNDGSTDGTSSIINFYSQKELISISVIDSVTNVGLLRGRMECANVAKGRYIAFVDADDAIDENYILAMQSSLEASNADIIEAQVCEGIGKTLKKHHYKSGEKYLEAYFDALIYSVVWGKAIRTSVMRNVARMVNDEWDWRRYPKVNLNEDLILTPLIYMCSDLVVECFEAMNIAIGNEKEHMTSVLQSDEGKYIHARMAFYIALFIESMIRKHGGSIRVQNKMRKYVGSVYTVFLRSKNKTRDTLNEGSRMIKETGTSPIMFLIYNMNAKSRLSALKWIIIRR